MHDLSGLGVPVIVTFGGLPGAEHIQRSAGEVGINQRVLQRDDQAVAAEKGDEPRHARRRHELQVVRALDRQAQGGHVTDRLPIETIELLIAACGS